MLGDRRLQTIYKYLVENINEKELKQLIEELRDYTLNGSMVDYEVDTDNLFQENSYENAIECEIDFILNNTEDEEYTNLTDEQIKKITSGILDEVLNDNELNEELNTTINYYAKHYIENHKKELGL